MNLDGGTRDLTGGLHIACGSVVPLSELDGAIDEDTERPTAEET